MAKGRRTDPLHVIVQGKHLDVTPALREYAEEKVGKISRYFDQVQEAQVVLSVERRDGMGKAQVVEVTVWGDGLVDNPAKQAIRRGDAIRFLPFSELLV